MLNEGSFIFKVIVILIKGVSFLKWLLYLLIL